MWGGGGLLVIIKAMKGKIISNAKMQYNPKILTAQQGPQGILRH